MFVDKVAYNDDTFESLFDLIFKAICKSHLQGTEVLHDFEYQRL